LGSSWVCAQLEASQAGLSSMKLGESCYIHAHSTLLNVHITSRHQTEQSSRTKSRQPTQYLAAVETLRIIPSHAKNQILVLRSMTSIFANLYMVYELWMHYSFI
jgi:hypothetical protein